MKIKPRVGWVRADRVPDESAAQEILRLRNKIDELNAHLADTETAAPAGSEDLAKGEEKISIRFKYEGPINVNNLRVVLAGIRFFPYSVRYSLFKPRRWILGHS